MRAALLGLLLLGCTSASPPAGTPGPDPFTIDVLNGAWSQLTVEQRTMLCDRVDHEGAIAAAVQILEHDGLDALDGAATAVWLQDTCS